MSDAAQSGWRKVYRKLYDNEKRPFLPCEVADLTVPQFVLVMCPDPDEDQLRAWRG